MEQKIEISKGSYQKIIEADPNDTSVQHRRYMGKNVFEIEVGKKTGFRLKVINASNREATKENAYWIAQNIKYFGTTKFLGWKTVRTIGGIKSDTSIKNKPFHELLNELNQGSEKHKNAKKYTLSSTGGVGENYKITGPYLDMHTKNKAKVFGDLSYTTDTLGAGIWLEGINYLPEFDSQGAFIIGVGEPQILSFFVEKRIQKENEVDKKFKKGDTKNVEQQLIYGDILDLHLYLHNVIDYSAHIEVECNGKSVEIYHHIIQLPNHFDKKNPGLNYNLKIIDELLVDLRWAKIAKHKEGKKNKDSLLEFTMIVRLVPQRGFDSKFHEKILPILEKTVTFTVNYKEDFSFDIDEPKYIAQVAKIYQPPLVTQSFETCGYSEIKITPIGEDSFTLLKEEINGALTQPWLSKDNKTPVYELVAGNNVNRKEITIDVDSLVDDCVNEETHIGQVINTENTPIYDYKAEYEDSLWGKVKKFVNTKNNIFGNVQPFEQDSKNDKQLKFKAAYPYNAYSVGTFLLRYLTFQLKPVPIFIGIHSCRYSRTPQFYVYPDVVWAMHLNYDTDNILYHNGKTVDLVEGHATYISYLAAGVNYLNEKIKPFLKAFIKGVKNKELTKEYEILQKTIDEFVAGNITKAQLGFHALYDGDKEKINYAKLQPYKGYLHYLIIKMVILSLAVDLLMLYLTRGKLAPNMMKAGKIAKKYKKFKGYLKSNDLSVTLPKISMNAAIYKEQYTKSLDDNKDLALPKVATIFEYRLQAQPFLALNHTYEFDDKVLENIKEIKKFKLKVVTTGEINYDIKIKYHSLAKTFSVEDADRKTPQKLNPTDVFKKEKAIKLEIDVGGSIELEEEFHMFWKLIAIKTSLDAKGELNVTSAIRVMRKIGVDKVRGPYLEDVLHFDGVKGTYFQKVETSVEDDTGWISHKTDSNPENETVPFTLFEAKSTSLGKNHLFEMFSKPVEK